MKTQPTSARCTAPITHPSPEGEGRMNELALQTVTVPPLQNVAPAQTRLETLMVGLLVRITPLMVVVSVLAVPAFVAVKRTV